MAGKNVCVWYNETSAMKRAYDAGRLDKKWLEEYCFNGGENCVRKRRWEGEDYISPAWVLPDGSVDEGLKADPP